MFDVLNSNLKFKSANSCCGSIVFQDSIANSFLVVIRSIKFSILSRGKPHTFRSTLGLLQEGDYLQASEKYSGAAVQMIKVIAAKRGLELGMHRSVSEFMSMLDVGHPE